MMRALGNIGGRGGSVWIWMFWFILHIGYNI